MAIALPLMRIVIVMPVEIFLAGMVATMLLVVSMPIITLLVTFTAPLSFTALVVVVPFVSVFLIVVLATAGRCDGGH